MLIWKELTTELSAGQARRLLGLLHPFGMQRSHQMVSSGVTERPPPQFTKKLGMRQKQQLFFGEVGGALKRAFGGRTAPLEAGKV